MFWGNKCILRGEEEWCIRHWATQWLGPEQRDSVSTLLTGWGSWQQSGLFCTRRPPPSKVSSLDSWINIQAALPIGTGVFGCSKVAWLDSVTKEERSCPFVIVFCFMQRRLVCLNSSVLPWYFLFQSVGFLLCLALFLCMLLTGQGVWCTHFGSCWLLWCGDT